MTDKDNTREIDEFLSNKIPKQDDDILVGWVISYEVMKEDGRHAAGFVYEFNDMTPWRAVGLLKWSMTTILARIRNDND